MREQLRDTWRSWRESRRQYRLERYERLAQQQAQQREDARRRTPQLPSARSVDVGAGFGGWGGG
jgi:hypothetical protein